jgi:hypothetical protein
MFFFRVQESLLQSLPFQCKVLLKNLNIGRPAKSNDKKNTILMERRISLEIVIKKPTVNTYTYVQ